VTELSILIMTKETNILS